MPRGITITDRFQLLDYGLAFVGLDDAGQCIETMEDNFKAKWVHIDHCLRPVHDD